MTILHLPYIIIMIMMMMSITHPTTLSLLCFARNLNSDAKPKKLLILNKYNTDDPWFKELQGNKVLSTMILNTMNDNALEMVKCMNMDFDNPILWNIFCHSLGQAFVT